MTEVRTTCPYCGVGCGVIAKPAASGGWSVHGDPSHPANLGRLCSKGSALAETLGLEDRLLTPRVGGAPTGWNAALDLVASRFRDAIDQHGPDSVGFYVSGQLLTEDYYVANKLMKGFIGSANIDTNSRLCMSSSVAGHKRAFGTDTVPGQYMDLEEADLVVLVGSNLAWCHPVLYQRIVAAKKARPFMKVVNIDPRRTATCDIADLHLQIAPAGDVALFNGLLAWIAEKGAVDAAYVARHVEGFEVALSAARSEDLSVTGLPPQLLREFFDLWVRTEKTVTVFSQGVNQSSSGTDKVNAILNCHLATGRIGRPGMGPFSVTGQPNAMGGREVGGLANMLACHLDLENSEHRAAVRDFWNAPAIPSVPGLKAVDMFRAAGEGGIKALWIIHTNPAVSMPEADAVCTAIEACEFVVVSDVTAATDTARRADVVLPAMAWGEKDGTVTNSERCISRQRPFATAPDGPRADWRILCDVAGRLGWAAQFDYDGPAEIFREYAALSGIAGRFGRDFDISGLVDLSTAEYDALAPTVWPLTTVRAGGRFFADGGFFTESGRGQMLPLKRRGPAADTTAAFPFRFNTGRVRDHWHTMTRTAKSPRLSQHMGEPYLEIHPEDAAVLGLQPATIAEVTSPLGRALLRVVTTDRVRPGEVFAPMHWTSESASQARIDALVPSEVDPISGQPESKAAAVSVAPFSAAWYGFAVAGGEIRPRTAYWAKARTKTGWRAELADAAVPQDWEQFARDLFDRSDADAVSVIDAHRGVARVALLDSGRVVATLYAAPDPVAVARAHITGRIGESDAGTVLAGRPGADRPDPGATVCACFDVGVNTILSAIRTGGLTSVEEIGAVLQAGTSCGSCRPELAALLANAAAPRAAE
ncbi:nitrate reductase [Tropicimonas isoalkanivorans]|uniref:Assimilatory nitrate reductase (NADH) alpha subunit apoprotein n=1 Tax=Tropicimonas isoalkanivorans TaxID=441112 RepID=A0A1I1DI65_9RHOB|nr:nitrate reductase [Tropicimonas isoalkanivorans]SFB74557.1 assimilatory nitrate reductase (NADH) alpha subunit apoprotein [Tropicimonas isoalkanivorans]